MKRLPALAGWSFCTAAILALDWFSPNVDLAPLVVVPLLGFLNAFTLRISVLMAPLLAAGVVIVESLSDHRIGYSIVALILNAAFLTVGYVVAILLFSLVRALLDETREMIGAVRSLQSSVLRLFPAMTEEMFGWRVSVIDARQPSVRREFHQLSRDVEGCEVIVGDASAPGLNDMLVLSALRGLLANGAESDPAERLRSLNRHLIDVDGGAAPCKTWCGFLSTEGVLSYAAGGYGTTIVRKGDGAVETSDVGGNALGLFSEIDPPQRCLFFEQGETALVAGDGLMKLLRNGAIGLSEIFEDPSETANKIRRLEGGPHAFGVVIERRWLGPIERLRRNLLGAELVT